MNIIEDNNTIVNGSLTAAGNAINYIGGSWLLSWFVTFILGALITYLWIKYYRPVSLYVKALKDRIKNQNYRIIGFRKHVTAYKNGHGIILQDIELMIHNPEKPFRRELNVSDVPEGFSFKSLDDLQKTSVEDRFNQQGFWYDSNPKNIIRSVRQVTNMSTDTKLVFEFIFDLDHTNKHVGKAVKLMYGYSIPSIYPIRDGVYNPDYAADNPFMTGFQVNYKMDYYTGVIGLENGIKIAENIGVDYYENGIDNEYTTKKMSKKDDLFYDKYEVTIKKPKIASLIITKIKLQDS